MPTKDGKVAWQLTGANEVIEAANSARAQLERAQSQAIGAEGSARSVVEASLDAESELASLEGKLGEAIERLG